jgi:beta-glucosidase
VKHFAVNFQEYDRHHVSSDLDDRTLHEMYLPAFEAAVNQGGVGALMTAYNLVNGVHCSEDPRLLREVLKERWGFDGVVMSDWVSTYSAKEAANAGLDLEMPTAEWLNRAKLLPLIESGEVSLEVIDDKVRRLLRLAACFGWLDHEQLDTTIAHDDSRSQQVALELARGGIVLLKNDGILPLDAHQLGTIAVLGPYADPAVFSGGGSAFTTPAVSTSVLEGLKRLVGEGVRLLHATGPEPNPERLVFSNSLFVSELGAGLVAEYYNAETPSGPPAVTRLDERLNFTWGPSAPMPEITVEHFSARWHGRIEPHTSGRHLVYSRSHDSVYRVVLDGKTLIDTWTGERNGLHTFEVDLEAGHTYSLEVVWKKTRYWGGMQLGWECIENRSQEIARCVALAKQADLAVVCVGFDNVSEGEGFDRRFAMHEQLERLVVEVSRVQPNTVVVLTAGGNLDMQPWLDGVRGLLFASYPGQEGGQAVAEILFGEVNPSGKLPATFEKRLEDRSSYASYHDDDGDHRVQLVDGIFTGYRHMDRVRIEPQFPFGFGLSYTTFTYENLELSKGRIAVDETLVISIDVVNVGVRHGSEVVQIYVRDVEASVPRPYKELKGFAKVSLAPSERKRLTVELGARAFAFYDVARRDWVVEPGAFEILVGASATDIRKTAMLEVG